MSLPLTPLAEALPASVPFVGPESQERARGALFRARVGANESVFGPSPRAIEAMAAAARDVWMYGDPENHNLREALAAHHGIAADRIAVDGGIDSLLGLTVRLMVEPGTAVVTSAGAYPTFNYHVAGFGGRLITVPYRDDHEDPDALIAAAAQHGARLVYLANPDNPMGTCHGAARIEAMLDALPEGAVLCLDEAYVEFAPEGTAPPLSLEHPRLLRFRTFSKAYGMAGARVGYVIGTPDAASAYNKVRNHFGMCRISQAGALAALGDPAHLADVLRHVAAAKETIGAIANRHGLTALPSATNFVAVDTGRDGAFATALMKALAAEGVFVRMPFVAPQNRCIRISAGTAADLSLVDEALGRFLAALNTSA